MEQHIESGKQVMNTASVLVAGGALINALPPIAALFSILWSALMIWESQTVQAWRAKRKAAKSEQLPKSDSNSTGA